MGECRGCRWWESIEEEEPGMGKCGALGFIRRGDYIQITLGGRTPEILTGELFGCFKFEPKG